jgi:hypothetical protein
MLTFALRRPRTKAKERFAFAGSLYPSARRVQKATWKWNCFVQLRILRSRAVNILIDKVNVTKEIAFVERSRRAEIPLRGFGHAERIWLK